MWYKPKVKTFSMKHDLSMRKTLKKDMLQFQEKPTRS